MYLLFDIGGTNTRITFSKNGKDIGEPVIFQTPQDFEEAMISFASAVKNITNYDGFKYVCGGVPGVFDKDTGTLLSAPNLTDWVDKPIKKRLEEIFGVPVFIENDAALVALGESVYGAGKNFSIVEYITVSTGVGGARIVDQKIDEKSIGFEPGHEIIVFGSDVITLEEIVSGSALEKKFGKKPKEINDPLVWEELAEKLAFGLHNTIVLWSPDVLVLGGSMIIGDPAISIDRVKFHLDKLLTVFPKSPIIKKAELGAFGGLWGALEFAKSKS
jgi:glucokinase